MIELDLFIEEPRFSGAIANWQAFAERAVQAALAQTDFAPLATTAGLYDLSLRLVDDATIRALNAETRGKNQPTNILSFQFLDAPDAQSLAAGPGATLGDLVMAYETTSNEAIAQGKSFDAHAAHLIVHGVLHLLGFDHVEESQAEDMEAVERRALAQLGIADPYEAKWTAIDTHE